MEASDETHSIKITSVDEFENNLSAENMCLLGNLRIKELVGQG